VNEKLRFSIHLTQAEFIELLFDLKVECNTIQFSPNAQSQTEGLALLLGFVYAYSAKG
jgi:hypothetical protein